MSGIGVASKLRDRRGVSMTDKGNGRQGGVRKEKEMTSTLRDRQRARTADKGNRRQGLWAGQWSEKGNK